MATSIIYLALVFGGLSAVFLLLVAAHDAIETWVERRAEKMSHQGGQGSLPLSLPSPQRVDPPLRPTPKPALTRGLPSSHERQIRPVGDRPAWLEAARRDAVHR